VILGAILTSAPDLAWVRQHVAGLDALKVIPAWGLPWTPERRAEAARLCPVLVVRTVAGDPSYADGLAPFPVAEQVIEEVRPWWEARDVARPFWIEIGNEPLIAEQDEVFAWEYAYWLDRAITACRAAFPGARLIAPAHLLNHPVPLGVHADGVPRFLEISADAYRRCDAVGVHAYTLAQWEKGRALVRRAVGPARLWLTEFALNEPLPDAVRGAAYARTLAPLDADAALVYHLDAAGGADPVHFNPHYRLSLETLRHLRGPAAPPPPMTVSDTNHYPHAQIGGGFLMDVRQWKTVAAFRRHLQSYNARQVAPWAKGATIHHSESPTAATWKSVESMLGMARFYLNERKWKRGPHLYAVSGSRNREWDGIWQLTPMNERGFHAGECNDDMLGLEVVGSFNSQRWDAGTSALALGATAVWLNWIGVGVSEVTVKGHRDCLPNKTCPGSAIQMDAVRRGVAALMEAL
jgi:hypothetical protein